MKADQQSIEFYLQEIDRGLAGLQQIAIANPKSINTHEMASKFHSYLSRLYALMSIFEAELASQSPSHEDSSDSSKPKPTFGSGRGKIALAPDFDEPLEEFEDYMP